MTDTLKIASISPYIEETNCWLQAVHKLLANLKIKVSFCAGWRVCCGSTDETCYIIMTNQLDETFQSAYKEFLSTETALLRVQNDILCSLD